MFYNFAIMLLEMVKDRASVANFTSMTLNCVHYFSKQKDVCNFFVPDAVHRGSVRQSLER